MALDVQKKMTLWLSQWTGSEVRAQIALVQSRVLGGLMMIRRPLHGRSPLNLYDQVHEKCSGCDRRGDRVGPSGCDTGAGSPKKARRSGRPDHGRFPRLRPSFGLRIRKAPMPCRDLRP
jgi:hypothetical protein